MKPITTFLLGIAFTLLISLTTVSIMTVRPQKPNQTVCFTTEDMSSAKDKVLTYSKSGFIVKDISTAYSQVIVVMEKY